MREPTMNAKPWRRWITPVQGYLGVLLLSLAAGAAWGFTAGLGTCGALLLIDAWRPRPAPPVLPTKVRSVQPFERRNR